MADPYVYVGQSVDLWLESHDEWCHGHIDEYQPGRGWHVQLYTGDDIWMLSLDQNIKFDPDFTVEPSEDDVIQIGNPGQSTILIVGRILRASNLPLPSPDDAETGCQTFFKILFAEANKSKISAFRTKTLVFTSQMSDENISPTWKRSTFDYEVLMPDDSTSESTASGDLVVAFYRTRSQGGNDYLGQTTFDLGNASAIIDS